MYNINNMVTVPKAWNNCGVVLSHYTELQKIFFLSPFPQHITLSLLDGKVILRTADFHTLKTIGKNILFTLKPNPELD